MDDEGYIRILAGCRDRGLKAIIHAGIDPCSPEHIHCPPELAADIVRELTPKGGEPFIALAHLGGIDRIEAVEKHLSGLPVYLDTAFVLETVESERLVELIRSHGYKKILFATDSPWRDAKLYIEQIKKMSFSEEITEAILGKNCARILNM
ncbi:MAG: amidohydrolase family protein [Clostridia bacterium]|nr:amidohydrolase family protein [Clostridia bacterium]